MKNETEEEKFYRLQNAQIEAQRRVYTDPELRKKINREVWADILKIGLWLAGIFLAGVVILSLIALR
jgi:hypothetical protein